MKNNKKHWWEYLWIGTSIYFVLGFFNILFGWLGLVCFLTPLMISIFKGNKSYCHHYCGRGQLLELLDKKLKISRNKPMPTWLKHKYFRYGFLVFFMGMFMSMLFNTYLVFQGTQSLQEVLTLLWSIKVPWHLSDMSHITPWVAQFAFGFYSLMLTSLILSIITLVLYKPRAWCIYCPMGTMTQLICKGKNR
ncbi:MAG: 4Fe-4S binding protein [Niameybacter sp.]|uniref:4Fe-4S binding protein n=1 Tax=Niameybacter sp. TaxID=2033640 RepID=UPI002FCB24C2